MKLGPYNTFEELGRGGMATVFRARRDGAAKDCVLKLLRLELEEDEVAKRRMLREAHLSSALSHPNIARLLDAGTAQGVFYLAFEFIEGLNLKKIAAQLREKNAVSPSIGVTVICKVLDGLEHAHTSVDGEGKPLGLVHRDLSPSNIMVSFFGEVKIIDFGLAAAQVDTFKTQPGRVVGTVRYMSPEQVRGAPVDRRSDLYTVGVVLYELLYGERLIPRGDQVQMMRAVLEIDVERLCERSILIPEALAKVVQRALARRPEQRFQSAAEFKTALLEAVAGTALMPRQDLAKFMRKHFAPARARGATQLPLEQTQTETMLPEGWPRRLWLEMLFAGGIAFVLGLIVSRL